MKPTVVVSAAGCYVFLLLASECASQNQPHQHMKRIFSILLVLSCFSMGVNSHAGENSFLPGEYKLIAYTLSNGSSEIHPVSSSSKSVSFHRLYISPNAMNSVLNREEIFPGDSQINVNKSSYQGFAIHAAYAPTPDITFHSSIGLTDTMENKAIDYTDRIGWEVDLGLAYKFLNNFAYEVHFGYMDTGELFRDSNSFTDVDNITIVINKLTMSF